MIFVWLGVLAVISAGFVILPLIWKRRQPIVSADAAPAVLIDQLSEVRCDLDRNLISKTEAAAAQVEIKRRILAAARNTEPPILPVGPSGCRGFWLAALFVPIIAIGYYMLMGSPEISSLAYADRQAERAEREKIEDLAEKLYTRLNSQPDGGATEGWMLLGQTYSRIGQYEKAVAAFETVAPRDDATSATFSMLAEALITAEKGIITPKAEVAVDRAMSLDTTNPTRVFYKAMALEQRGEESTAHASLLLRLDAADGFAPWMESFVVRANGIGERLGRDLISLTDYAPMMARSRGPTKEDVAAAGDLTEQDRAEFIRSMVDRLATRLEDEPDDLDGWLRLAKAYTVLGERTLAKSALDRASAFLAKIDPGDPRHEQVNRALLGLDWLPA